MSGLESLDMVVLGGYLLGVLGLSAGLIRRSNHAAGFMEADRNLPGWAVGLSIFGSYISSISFLANPGSSYGGNWNAFVFNLTAPLAACAAVAWFVPFYRRYGAVSAYAHLGERFGPWARTYCVVCFLLVQLGRMGTIVFLLALAAERLTGLDVKLVIGLIGLVMTLGAMMGGIQAAVWVGVVQSVVLTVGLVVCLVMLFGAVEGGAASGLGRAWDSGKMSVGDFSPGLTTSTFWVVFLYGLVINLQNFGTDQSYVQRYITARTLGDARRSVWMGAWMYVPVGAGFFLIGTLLFLYYQGGGGALPEGTAADRVFPFFITTELPAGLKGLVLAALLAAAMDSNLGNMATLTLCDGYQRYVNPRPSARQAMWVLRGSTVVWGALGVGVAMGMIGVQNVLEAWWKWVSVFSGGMLGLFLLALWGRNVGARAAGAGVAAGLGVTVWMTLSTTPYWPESLARFRSPLHSSMIIVVGTATVLAVGFAAGARGARRKRD